MPRLLFIFLGSTIGLCAAPATMNLLPRRDVEWPVYRGDPQGTPYGASLTKIARGANRGDSRTCVENWELHW